MRVYYRVYRERESERETEDRVRQRERERGCETVKENMSEMKKEGKEGSVCVGVGEGWGGVCVWAGLLQSPMSGLQTRIFKKADISTSFAFSKKTNHVKWL